MPHVSRAVLRTESVALQRLRWREETRRWIHAGCLPATREQLTAHLLRSSAPSWLVWRMSACLPADRSFESVEEIASLMKRGGNRAAPTRELYAG